MVGLEGRGLVTDLLTISEVAEALTLHRRSVGRLIARGLIRVVRPSPGRVAIPRSELDAYRASIERSIGA